MFGAVYLQWWKYRQHRINRNELGTSATPYVIAILKRFENLMEA